MGEFKVVRLARLACKMLLNLQLVWKTLCAVIMDERVSRTFLTLLLGETEIRWARLAWLISCFLGGLAGVASGSAWIVACMCAAAGLPVLVGAALRPMLASLADRVELLLFIAASTLGVAISGGLGSPLMVLFVTPIALAFHNEDRSRLKETVCFAVLGLAAAQLNEIMAGFQLPANEIKLISGLFAVSMMALLAVIAFTSAANRRHPDDERREPDPATEVSSVDMRIQELKALVDQAIARSDQAEKRASLAQSALGTRTRFFAQTNHELRTPLNAILGFSEMMKNEVFGPVPGKYRDYAALIHEGGKSLQVIVDDVLDLSKIETGRYEIFPAPISLVDHVEDAVRFLSDQARRRGVSLRMKKRGKDVEAFADNRAVRQIALNLISNALKFTPKGGSVEVRVQRATGGAALIVSDSGPGLDQATFQRVIQPFVQADDSRGDKAPKGTGLGLSVVHAFVELHGGKLLLNTRYSGGAQLIVWFPDNMPKELD